MSKRKTDDKPRESQPPCVELWGRAKDLCNQGIASLWERTKILCELVEDPDFLRRFVQADEAIVDVFQREVLWDTTVTFAELRTVYERFPILEQWQQHGVGTLLELAAEANATDRQTAVRERPRWKERAEELQSRVEVLEGEVRRLREENRELRKLVAEEPAFA